MGSHLINLKCSSYCVFTRIQPIKKQSPTEGLGQATCISENLETQWVSAPVTTKLADSEIPEDHQQRLSTITR